MKGKLSKEERKKRLANTHRRNMNNKDSIIHRKGVLDLAEYQDVQWYKPEAGRELNKIDIIPYIITSNKHPEFKTREGEYDYVFICWVHFNVGPGKDKYLCPRLNYGKACPICEEVERRQSAENIDKREEIYINSMKAKKRCYYNVISYKDPENIKVFEVSFVLFEKELRDQAQFDAERFGDDGVICFSDPENGYSIEFRGKEATFNDNDYLKYSNFQFVERNKQYPEDIVGKAYPFDKMLNKPTYAAIRASFLGVEEENQENEGLQKEDTKPVGPKNEEVDEFTTKKVVEYDKKVIDNDKEIECPKGLKFGVDYDTVEYCINGCSYYNQCTANEF